MPKLLPEPRSASHRLLVLVWGMVRGRGARTRVLSCSVHTLTLVTHPLAGPHLVHHGGGAVSQHHAQLQDVLRPVPQLKQSPH